MSVYDFFLQNWADQVEIESAYDTDIVTAKWSLAEERRGLADRPHRSVKLSWLGASQDETNRMLLALARAGDQSLFVPIYSDQSTTTASSSLVTINCPTTYRRFFVGGEVLIFQPDATGRPVNPEHGTVTAVAAGALTLAVNLVHTFPAGSIVMPMLECEVALNNEFEALTDRRGKVTATFLEIFERGLPPTHSATNAVGGLWGSQTSDANPYAPADTPIFTLPPNWNQPIKAKISRAGQRYGQGRTNVVETSGPRPTFEFTFTATLSSRAEVWSALNFFDSRRGRLIPFWLVSPVTAWTPVAVAAGYMDVTPSGNIEDVQDLIDYAAVTLTDGTVYTRKISGVAVSGGNWRISFMVDLPALTLGQISTTTAAHFVRFNKDALRETWHTDSVCEIDIDVVEVLTEGDTDPLVLPPCSTDFCLAVYAVFLDKVDPAHAAYVTVWKTPGDLVPATINLPGVGDPNALYDLGDPGSVVPTVSIAVSIHKMWTKEYEDSAVVVYTYIARVPRVSGLCTDVDPGDIPIADIPDPGPITTIVIDRGGGLLPTHFRQQHHMLYVQVFLAFFPLDAGVPNNMSLVIPTAIDVTTFLPDSRAGAKLILGDTDGMSGTQADYDTGDPRFKAFVDGGYGLRFPGRHRVFRPVGVGRPVAPIFVFNGRALLSGWQLVSYQALPDYVDPTTVDYPATTQNAYAVAVLKQHASYNHGTVQASPGTDCGSIPGPYGDFAPVIDGGIDLLPFYDEIDAIAAAETGASFTSLWGDPDYGYEYDAYGCGPGVAEW